MPPLPEGSSLSGLNSLYLGTRVRRIITLLHWSVNLPGSLCQGRFRQHMVVEIVNDGPVTIMLDSEEQKAPRRG